MCVTITVFGADRGNVVMFNNACGKIHKTHEDAMTVAWLARDFLYNQGYIVTLVYAW